MESVALDTWSSVTLSRAVVWIPGNVTIWFSSSLSLCSAQNSPFNESSSNATTDFPTSSDASNVNVTSCVSLVSVGWKSTVSIISSVSASPSFTYKVPVSVYVLSVSRFLYATWSVNVTVLVASVKCSPFTSTSVVLILIGTLLTVPRSRTFPSVSIVKVLVYIFMLLVASVFNSVMI